MKTRRQPKLHWVSLATLLLAPFSVRAGFPAPQDSHTVVVPRLKGLVFVRKQQDFHRDGVKVSGIDVSRVPLLDSRAFRARLAKYLNQPLTLDQLDEITRLVVKNFRDRHHPLVDAVAPAQNVQQGAVQVIVTEFRVGAVRPQGNRWFSDRVVTAPITLKHGDTVDSLQLVNELDAANANPFRRVNVVYRPAAEAGFTDVVLQTEDRLPLRIFTDFNNSGSPTTGRSRWDFGATWGNALWHDQQISYQFSSSDNLFAGASTAPGATGGGASFLAHSLTWTIPVRGRDSISLYGNYDRSVPNVGPDFGMVGQSLAAGARYNLSLRRTESLTHSAHLGYDFKSTNNNLDFGGTQVSRTHSQIDEFPVGYSASLTDRLGISSLTTDLFFSPGRLSADNNDAAFQPSQGQSGRDFAKARYVYWRSDFNRLTKLPENAVWSFRVMGQMSSSNLLFTEQLAGGGAEILRGYDPNSVLGDQGLIISNELRTPSFHRNGGFPAGQIQFLTFWDWAHLESVHDVDGAANHLNASSVGAGVRYSLRSNITAKFDYDWQLQHLPSADNRDHLANFSIVVAY